MELIQRFDSTFNVFFIHWLVRLIPELTRPELNFKFIFVLQIMRWVKIELIKFLQKKLKKKNKIKWEIFRSLNLFVFVI